MTDTNSQDLKQKIVEENLPEILYFVQDKKTELEQEEEERRRMYRLKAAFLAALDMAYNQDVKANEVRSELENAYNAKINQEEENAYVYNKKEAEAIENLQNSLDPKNGNSIFAVPKKTLLNLKKRKFAKNV